MLKVKKAYFTLFEMLIVFLILSFGIVLTGVKVKEMYDEQRFFSDTQQVLSHLAMAQDLMLIMDTDVFVHLSFDQKNEKLKVKLDIEKPLEEGWARLIKRELSLTGIHAMEFEKNTVKELTLTFSLGKMSKGHLVLLEGEKKRGKDPRQLDIQLLGYPSSIGEKKEPPKEDNREDMSKRLYPEEVRKKLYEDPNQTDRQQ